MSPFGGEEYALLLLDATDGATREEYELASSSIQASGCRYAVCAGEHGSQWDDAIDMSAITVEIEQPENPPPFVMTTWHDGEPLSEVAFHLSECTSFDEFTSRNLMAVQFGGDASTWRDLLLALRGVESELLEDPELEPRKRWWRWWTDK